MPPPNPKKRLSSRDIYIICGCVAAAVALCTSVTLVVLLKRWRRKEAELVGSAGQASDLVWLHVQEYQLASPWK
jgi:hypothetical protein